MRPAARPGAAVVLLALAISPALRAQDAKAPAGASLAAFAGTWTTNADGDCARGTYAWAVAGDELRFVSATGQTDVERVVERRADGFVAVTVSSPVSAPGTRWAFRVLGPDTLRVRNLTTGREFPLHRCGVAAPAPAPGAARTSPAPSRPAQAAAGGWRYRPDGGGGTPDLIYAEEGDNHGSLYAVCAPDGRTFSLSLAARPDAGRSRVTMTAGGTATAFDATPGEGPITNLAATLPAGHPSLALLRSGEPLLRARAPGNAVNLDVPLRDAAEPVRRFEAACRPR